MMNLHPCEQCQTLTTHVRFCSETCNEIDKKYGSYEEHQVWYPDILPRKDDRPIGFGVPLWYLDDCPMCTAVMGTCESCEGEDERIISELVPSGLQN